ncbi:phospholipase A2 inhibitor and Ly6/PLAUR domain-containing protein-like [Lacerta agilis]|uniref:phospholipase A2 inhibitor and Ly6/PLAUR domain-containing protein-like n=1 Tax=Lacerta agilis TaxID=80427 RepID=UPI001419F7C3|nr:phospholipase A2 inhibitor and Ly6/PLAUR domain-containing protein-like [Lacerta agilis]
MNIFLTTCLLLVILSPVTALLCVGNTRHEYCHGICFTIQIDNHLNSTPNRRTKWGCMTDCTSDKTTFTTVGNKYFRNIKTCCGKQLCNATPPPRRDPKLNGLECPFYCQDSKAPKTVKCFDDETRCMDFILIRGDAKVPEVFQGCATPSFCEQASASMIDKYLSGNITRPRCYESFPSSEQQSFAG